MTQPATRTMFAAEYDEYGPASVVHLQRVPLPELATGEALVKVDASTVNPIDVVVRSGKLRLRTGKNFPKRVGIDFAGQLVDVAATSANLRQGDRVWGVMPLTIEKGFGQGSAAEFITIPVDRLAKAPDNLDQSEAAAVSSVGVGAVALIALRDKAAIKPGERLLIRGAAGGVGTMAVQFGALLGAHVTALVSAGDVEFVQGLGAAEAYDYRTITPTSLEPFDVVLDLVGTDLRRWRRRQTRQGRYYCLGIAGLGTIAALAESRIHGARRLRFFSAAPTGEIMSDLTVHVESGAIRPVVHSTYPLGEIASAQQSVERGGGRGKRVLVH